MNNTENSLDTLLAPPDIPYQNLYIDYLKGHVTPNDTDFGNRFIGNWQEDEFSFLFFSSPVMEIIDRVLQVQPQLTLLDQFRVTTKSSQTGHRDSKRKTRAYSWKLASRQCLAYAVRKGGLTLL